jgi:hypothetical protein
MTALILILGLLVWLVAAYALVRIALSWQRIWRAAPAGQGWPATLELWSLNFPAVRQRVGEAVSGDIERVAGSMKLFAGCALTLVALAVINIISGSAA